MKTLKAPRLVATLAVLTFAINPVLALTVEISDTDAQACAQEGGCVLLSMADIAKIKESAARQATAACRNTI